MPGIANLVSLMWRRARRVGPAAAPPALALAAAICLATAAAPSPARAASGVTCSKHTSTIWACNLPNGGIRTPVTFTEILDALKAAGGKVTAADPAMWVTAWGAKGSNGAKCASCAYDGGGAGGGGWAQSAISPATFRAEYGSDALYYSKGTAGQRGRGDSGEGGFGGGATVVAASPPGIASPGQAPPFWDVVVVAGGGGGGGGGGTLHTGGRGGHGGYPTASTFTRAASTAGSNGGGTGAGQGGNKDGAGAGGDGGCSPAWCDGADGVGGFGGFGQQGEVSASSGLYPSAVIPGLNFVDPGGAGYYQQLPVQTPGMGGGGAHQPDYTQEHTTCGTLDLYTLICGGGGGGGYGGGGAGDYKTTDGSAAMGGGGGGSYAADGTCDATGAPSVNTQSSNGALIVYVDPAQDCSSSLAAKPPRAAARPPGSAAVTRLARVLRPHDKAMSRRRTWRVALRLRSGARITRARLNGRAVTARLRRGSGRTWRASLRPRDGVRIGRNTVTARVGRGGKRYYATVHFTRVAGRRSRLVSVHAVRDAGLRRLRIRHHRRAGVQTRVTVNGRRVRSGHVARTGRLRLARLSASSGLRHGANRVVVRALSEDGELQTVARTFRIARNRPIAGAGGDRRGHVHARIELDGSRSLPPSGRRGMTYRWSIERAPRGSTARLVGADGAEAALRPDAPGRYRVRLKVSATNGLSSTDEATVTVDPLPYTPIDTLATGPSGEPGIQLDSAWFCPSSGVDTSCLFHANPAGDDSHVQSLVLDRDTLEVVSNTSYDPASLANLDKAISELVVADGNTEQPDSNKLVVVTLGSGAVTDVPNFSAAVTQIGVAPFSSKTTSYAAPFSIIGIPGMTEGDAWRSPGGTSKTGSLKGYIKDSAYYTDSGVLETEQRVFAFPEVVGYETRVVDGKNVDVQLSTYDPADRTYSTSTLASFDTTGGGLGVVTFNEWTLAIKESQTFRPTTPAIDWSAVGELLQHAADSKDGAIIVSLGQMSGYSSEPTASDFTNQVLPAIRALGGQPDIFARAVNDNLPYSFVGSAGQGAETSAALVAGVPTRGGPDGTTPLPVTAGNLTGEFRRAATGRYIPSVADPTGLTSPELNPVLYQAPTDWPDTPAAGAISATGTETALAWLAQCRLLPAGTPVVAGVALWAGQDCDTDTAGTSELTGTPDVAAVREVALSLRADYYDNVNLTLNNIAALTYSGLFPAGNAVFSASDFTAAQTQLTAEAGNIAAAKAFFATMTSEISSSQASLTNALTQVATTVQQAYFAQQKTVTVKNYGAWALGLFKDFATAASTVAALYAAPQVSVGNLFKVASVFAAAGNGFSLIVNGPQTSEYNDIEAWLVLDEQLQNDTASVDQAVIDSVGLQQQGFAINQEAVLSDPGRLATVAANAQDSWSISADSVAQAANAFVIAARQQIWQAYANKLWTAAYQPALAPIDYDPFGPTHNVVGYYCANKYQNDDQYVTFPFMGAVEIGFPTGLGHGVQYWPLNSVAPALASGAPNAPSYWPYVLFETGGTELAPQSALAAIFAQPAGLNSSASSAGAFGPWFWDQTFDLTRSLSDNCLDSKIETVGGEFYGQTNSSTDLGAVAMTQRRFAPARSGTAFRFTLSEPARVDVTVRRALAGRRLGSRCVRPGAGLGGGCTRYRRVDRVSRPSARSRAGTNRIRYSGRGLSPGRYRATLRATDRNGNRSDPVSVTFTVMP